jgi:hypothetical protein
MIVARSMFTNAVQCRDLKTQELDNKDLLAGKSTGSMLNHVTSDLPFKRRSRPTQRAYLLYNSFSPQHLPCSAHLAFQS